MIMAAVIIVAGIRPDKVFDFFLENFVVFCFLVFLVATYRKLPFSDLSYLIMLVYLSFHEWGAHYKYSDVPLGEWMKPWLHTNRNMYDRVLHFSFGLFMSYPIQEGFMRTVGVRSRWRYILPIEAILALSAVYEILEAFMAMILSPQRGEEFVGMQGDIFDSQKDMFVAFLGSVAGMLILAALRHYRPARVTQPAAMRAVAE